MSGAKAPTSALSQRMLRKAGHWVEVVETWQTFVHDPKRKIELLQEGRPIARRADLFGVADLLAVKLGGRPLLVQTTTKTNLAAHRNKALAATTIQPKEIDERQTPYSTLSILLGGGFDYVIHAWWKDETVNRWRVIEEVAVVLPEGVEQSWTARTPLSGGYWLAFQNRNPDPIQRRLAL